MDVDSPISHLLLLPQGIFLIALYSFHPSHINHNVIEIILYCFSFLNPDAYHFLKLRETCTLFSGIPTKLINVYVIFLSSTIAHLGDLALACSLFNFICAEISLHALTDLNLRKVAQNITDSVLIKILSHCSSLQNLWVSLWREEGEEVAGQGIFLHKQYLYHIFMQI